MRATIMIDLEVDIEVLEEANKLRIDYRKAAMVGLLEEIRRMRLLRDLQEPPEETDT